MSVPKGDRLQSDEARLLFWPGNIAKARIVGEILERAAGRPVTVLDFGCGNLGQWPQVMRSHTTLRLIGYEPDPRAIAEALERARGLNAEVWGGDGLEKLTGDYDYIVSFSVFEHIHDRAGYLRTASRLLASHGTFFLNYDDGHFRHCLDPEAPAASLRMTREWLKNSLAPLWLWVGLTRWYQSRVTRSEADRLVREAGFVVRSERYENLLSFKDLAKTLPPEKRVEFADFWKEVEEVLNRRFLVHGEPRLGDSANLWSVLGSRTLELVHAQR